MAFEALVVIGFSLLAGVVYHLMAYHAPGKPIDFAKVGAVVALFRLIPYFQQQAAGVATRWTREALRHELYLWNMSFLCLLALGFVSKITGVYSRGATILFYATGLPILMLWQHLWMRIVGYGLRTGWIATRRGLLFGSPAKVVEFTRKYRSWGSGLIIAQTIMLPEKALEHTKDGDAALQQ